MNKRLKVYGIAIPIFLVLSLVFGAFAQFGGEMYRDSYYEAGAQLGFQVGYQYGMGEGYQYGVYAGYQYGLQEGYQYGYMQAKPATYVNTVLAMDDPYHMAALALEEEYLDLDIAHMLVLPLNDYEGEGIVVLLALPMYVDGETGTFAGWTLEQLPDDYLAAISKMIKAVWQDEPYVKFALFGTMDAYYPDYYFRYDLVVYETKDVIKGNWDAGMRSEGDLELAAQLATFPKAQSPWPWNPFYLAELQAAQEAQRSGSTTASTPK